jgi:hypothetical protein
VHYASSAGASPSHSDGKGTKKKRNGKGLWKEITKNYPEMSLSVSPRRCLRGTKKTESSKAFGKSLLI